MSKKLKQFLVLSCISALTIGLLGLPVGAVHEQTIIELEGDVADTSPGTDPRDWASVFDANGDPISANLPAGTIDTTGVIQDFMPGGTGDSSYHQSGNEDRHPINENGTQTWGCKTVQNASDKNDIVNAYALAANGTGSHSSDVLMYFGVERNDNSGDAFLGVWLFQADVGCDAAKRKFTGKKTNGDILILSNFTDGGSLSSLKAYRWQDNVADPANGSGTLTEINTGFECSTISAGDDLCAEVNQADVVVPWPMEDKEKPAPPNPDPPQTLEKSQFFEGGFSLSDLVPGAPCFSSFMAESRASTQLTASLKDFALGDLDTCASVTAHKFHDLDGSGDQDAGEPDLSGWEMKLYSGSGCGSTPLETGTTDSSGEVRFTGLSAGAYSVGETQQSGWTVTTGGLCQDLNVTAGSSPVASFGNQRPGSITAHKFEDVDGNGVADAGDANLGSWEMTLYTTSDCSGGSLSSGSTDATTGETVFGPLAAGTYSIRETMQNGWQATTAGGTCQDVTIPSNGSGFVSFGNQQLPGAVQAEKFNDLNGNSTHDLGEPMLEDWPMTLHFGFDCVDAVASSGSTDADGTVLFPDLLVGDYSMAEGSDPDWSATSATCQNVTVTRGATETVTFGNWQPSSITALKFEDNNGNGIQDADDPPLQGWEMTLHSTDNCTGSPISAALTGPDGKKIFDLLAAGTYSIKETMQDGWEASTAECQSTTLAARADVTLTFGNKKTVVLGDIVDRVEPAPGPAPDPIQLPATGAPLSAHLWLALGLIVFGLICLLLQPRSGGRGV